MDKTKELITDKAINSVLDELNFSSEIYDKYNIREFIYTGLSIILRGDIISKFKLEFLKRLGLITHHTNEITELGKEYIYLYRKDKNEKENSKLYDVIGVCGNEYFTEDTEIRIKSTGEKIEKGDTVYHKDTNEWVKDVYFDDNLTLNFIRGTGDNGNNIFHLSKIVVVDDRKEKFIDNVDLHNKGEIKDDIYKAKDGMNTVADALIEISSKYKKMEMVCELLESIHVYSDFKPKTSNEKKLQGLLKELGYYKYTKKRYDL